VQGKWHSAPWSIVADAGADWHDYRERRRGRRRPLHPHKDELDLQKTCINLLFDGLLGTKLTDENRDQQRELTEKAQVLAFGFVCEDVSRFIGKALKVFARHEQLAPKAADLLAPDLMPEVNLRADAARDLIIALLENKQFDLAYAAFSRRRHESSDGRSQPST